MTEEQLAELSDEELEELYRKEKIEQMDEEPQDNPDNESDPVSNEAEDNISENTDANSDDEQNDEVEEDTVAETSQEPEVAEEDNSDKEPSDEATTGSEDDTEQASDETPMIELPALKASGKEIPIQSLEELYTLASAGFDYTKKTQKLAKHKKAVSMMEENGISERDLSLFIEAKQGNKDALAALVKEAGLDPLDIEEPAGEYVPGAYIPDDKQLMLKEIEEEISMDPEYDITVKVVNEMMDPISQEKMAQDPIMIKLLHEDIKNGVYDNVAVQAEKLKVIDGGKQADIDYYIQAARMMFPPQQPQQPVVQQGFQQPVMQQPVAQQPLGSQQQVVQQQEPKRSVDTSKRKAAGPTRAKVPPKKVINVDEMSDDELMKMKEEILSRY